MSADVPVCAAEEDPVSVCSEAAMMEPPQPWHPEARCYLGSMHQAEVRTCCLDVSGFCKLYA